MGSPALFFGVLGLFLINRLGNKTIERKAAKGERRRKLKTEKQQQREKAGMKSNLPECRIWAGRVYWWMTEA